MRCADIMKREVVSVSPKDTAALAAQRMRDMNVGFLPVCDRDGRVLGTLTDRDIATRVVADDRLASHCLIGDIMSLEPVTCRGTDELSHAEDLMIAHQKSRILITTNDGLLQGVLSLSDLVQLAGSMNSLDDSQDQIV